MVDAIVIVTSPAISRGHSTMRASDMRLRCNDERESPWIGRQCQGQIARASLSRPDVPVS